MSANRTIAYVNTHTIIFSVFGRFPYFSSIELASLLIMPALVEMSPGTGYNSLLTDLNVNDDIEILTSIFRR
jgi:hypothetical protein